MKRRRFLQTSALATAAAIAQPRLATATANRSITEAPATPAPRTSDYEEFTVAQLQTGMRSGKLTSLSITEKYLQRIKEIDKSGPAINAVIEINPDAQAIARALDRERKDKGSRGPLHGIPVLIKDNIDTADRMMTTAGSLALLGSTPALDSTVAKKL